MNELLVTVFQWVIAAIFISGGALVIWMLIKNSGIGRLLKGLYDALSDASRMLGNQLSACAKDFWGSKCWIKWVVFSVLGAQIIFGAAKFFKDLYRTRVDSKLADARGKGLTDEEANRMTEQAEKGYEDAASKNPEKFENYSDEDKIQIQKESILRKFKRDYKKLLEKTDKTEQEKQQDLQEMEAELDAIAKEAAEDNPDGDDDVDDGVDDVDDEMDNMPDFFE